MDAPGTPGASLDSFDYLLLSIMFLDFIFSLCFVIYLICLYKKWSFKQGVSLLILGKIYLVIGLTSRMIPNKLLNFVPTTKSRGLHWTAYAAAAH